MENKNSEIPPPAPTPTSLPKDEGPTPKGLIAATWILCACTFIPFTLVPYIGIICSIAMLVCAIILACSKNRLGRINGIVALSIWIITFLIGCFFGLAAGFLAGFQ